MERMGIAKEHCQEVGVMTQRITNAKHKTCVREVGTIPEMVAAGAASILRAFDCKYRIDSSKFVLKNCHFHNKCSTDCELDIDTDDISIPAVERRKTRGRVVGCMH